MTPDRPARPDDRTPPPHRNDEPPFPAAPGHDFTVRRRTLIALLIAAIVLPCIYVAAMAYNDLRTREADATDTTLRTVRVAEEHALKVFDLNEVLDARVVDLMQGLDDAGIRNNEAQFHTKLDAIGGGYPQVASVSIFGRDGTLLASSRYSPPPPVSIAGREDFTGIRAGRMADHVSRVMVGAVSGETVFNMASRARTPRAPSRDRLCRVTHGLLQRLLSRTAGRRLTDGHGPRAQRRLDSGVLSAACRCDFGSPPPRRSPPRSPAARRAASCACIRGSWATT